MVAQEVGAWRGDQRGEAAQQLPGLEQERRAAFAERSLEPVGEPAVGELGDPLPARREVGCRMGQIDTRSAAGRLVLNVLASVSQWEREAIGERTATAMQHKASKGEYTGGYVRYGYALASDGQRLLPVPAEQAVLATARELRAAGLSLRKVAAELTRRGLRSRVGRPFGPKQVNEIAN